MDKENKTENKVLNITSKKEEAFLRKRVPHLNLSHENKKELKTLIKNMWKIMKENNGIGLSANQIGLHKRLFVAQVPDENGRPKFYAIINPEIIKSSSQKMPSEEGCLSVPLETTGIVERPEKITLQGFNAEGKKIKIKAWGLLARIFQHELDHLNGMLFIDRVKKTKK